LPKLRSQGCERTEGKNFEKVAAPFEQKNTTQIKPSTGIDFQKVILLIQKT
jgi:hypothetical protein